MEVFGVWGIRLRDGHFVSACRSVATIHRTTKNTMSDVGRIVIDVDVAVIRNAFAVNVQTLAGVVRQVARSVIGLHPVVGILAMIRPLVSFLQHASG